MRERPIIFSGPMVLAILDGRKTQTRRVVRGGALDGQPAADAVMVDYEGEWWDVLDGPVWSPVASGPYRCPFGRPGDRLWVRETFASPVASWTDYGWEWDEDDGARLPGGKHRPGNQFAKRGVQYRASADEWAQSEVRWRPSIHMPRWASRLTLEVTDVRVERLQNITPEDAIAEGLSSREAPFGPMYDCGPLPTGGFGESNDPREAFMYLWDRLNGKKPGCAWADDPWVWAITFKRVES